MIPSFARVEITIRGKADIAIAAADLQTLAGELDDLAASQRDDEEAAILAHHKIRAVSQKLRRRE